MPVQQTLRYLRQHLQLDHPAGSETLLGARTSIGSRLTQRLVARRQPGAHPFVRGLARNTLAYSRLRRIRPNIGLGKFLCLVNDLDMPPAACFAHFARLSAVVARQRFEMWATSARARLKGRRRAVLSMALARPDQIEGLYATEYYDGRVFRWSEPDATIRLSLPAADYAVVLDLLPNREWPKGTVTIKLNRSPVVCNRLDSNAIHFVLTKEMFVAHREQRLVLRCTPWEAATGDPRRLGFPLIGVQFETIAMAPAAQGEQSSRRSKVDK